MHVKKLPCVIVLYIGGPSLCPANCQTNPFSFLHYNITQNSAYNSAFSKTDENSLIQNFEHLIHVLAKYSKLSPIELLSIVVNGGQGAYLGDKHCHDNAGVLENLFCCLSDCCNYTAHHTVLSPKLSDCTVNVWFSLHDCYQVQLYI